MRRPLQLSLFAVVLLGLIGGTLAFFVAQKSVTLTVDGQSREVGTYAATVGDVLDEVGLEPTAHDVVLPSAGQAVGDPAWSVSSRRESPPGSSPPRLVGHDTITNTVRVAMLHSE